MSEIFKDSHCLRIIDALAPREWGATRVEIHRDTKLSGDEIEDALDKMIDAEIVEIVDGEVEVTSDGLDLIIDELGVGRFVKNEEV